jgi:hypothetical protein
MGPPGKIWGALIFNCVVPLMFQHSSFSTSYYAELKRYLYFWNFFKELSIVLPNYEYLEKAVIIMLTMCDIMLVCI